MDAYEENKETGEWTKAGTAMYMDIVRASLAVGGVLLSPFIAIGAAGVAIAAKGEKVAAYAKFLGRWFYHVSSFAAQTRSRAFESVLEGRVRHRRRAELQNRISERRRHCDDDGRVRAAVGR